MVGINSLTRACTRVKQLVLSSYQFVIWGKIMTNHQMRQLLNELCAWKGLNHFYCSEKEKPKKEVSATARDHKSESEQLPHCFLWVYRMTRQSAVNILIRYLTWSHPPLYCSVSTAKHIHCWLATSAYPDGKPYPYNFLVVVKCVHCEIVIAREWSMSLPSCVHMQTKYVLLGVEF